MTFRYLHAGLALAAAATVAEAGPFRRHAQPVYQYAYQPVYQSPIAPSAVTPVGMTAANPAPAATPTASGDTPAVTPTAATGAVAVPDGDGLDEVNARRSARGLRPFLRDENLTQAARACVQFRAAYGLIGHTANDFGFVPAGASATSAGCAAVPVEFGWMSCCTYENHTYAGAAWVMGRDGRRYMHLFVR